MGKVETKNEKRDLGMKEEEAVKAWEDRNML